MFGAMVMKRGFYYPMGQRKKFQNNDYFYKLQYFRGLNLQLKVNRTKHKNSLFFKDKKYI
jgi:hypothetical protein